MRTSMILLAALLLVMPATATGEMDEAGPCVIFYVGPNDPPQVHDECIPEWVDWAIGLVTGPLGS